MESNDQKHMNPVPPPIPETGRPRGDQARRVVLFILLGLAPVPISLATITVFASRKMDSQIMVFLLVVDVAFSLVASIGIVGVFTPKRWLHVVLSLALGLSLSALNAVVSVFTGCLLLAGKAGH